MALELASWRVCVVLCVPCRLLIHPLKSRKSLSTLQPEEIYAKKAIMLVEDAMEMRRAKWTIAGGLWILVFPSSGGEFDPVDRVLDAAAPRRPREDRAVLEAGHDVQGRWWWSVRVDAVRAATRGRESVLAGQSVDTRRGVRVGGCPLLAAIKTRLCVLNALIVDVAQLDSLTGREADRFEIGSDLLDRDDTVSF